MGWDSRANVRGSDLLMSPAVLGKCEACDIMQIYPHGLYYYKEQGYDSEQVPAVQVFYVYHQAECLAKFLVKNTKLKWKML